jgi:hypothetical protein
MKRVYKIYHNALIGYHIGCRQLFTGLWIGMYQHRNKDHTINMLDQNNKTNMHGPKFYFYY